MIFLTKETKPKLLDQYRKTKRARLENARRGVSIIKRVAYTLSSPRSSLLRTSFARGAIESSVMADERADADFISAILLNKFQQKLGSIQMESVNPPQLFRGVTGGLCLSCSNTFKLDVYLQIRHGTWLLLRNIQ